MLKDFLGAMSGVMDNRYIKSQGQSQSQNESQCQSQSQSQSMARHDRRSIRELASQI